ncbi:methyl-accepting chemotaxis protein [Desulfotomaculum sp. 1211_IL3151]|uniref:methyl-accepting chemotaxis protein n=1 Tax=Desulfotomaculum sp. 1211_IL3151 TaxID=3084055 RepID=UPI002FDB85F4
MNPIKFTGRTRREKSIQHRLLLLFTLLITLAIGILGLTTYLVAKQTVEVLIEDKLIVSAKNIAETVEFYTSTVDSRDFTTKVEYLLNKERAAFTTKGLKPVLLFIDSEAKPAINAAGSNNAIPDKILKTIGSSDAGIKSVLINADRYSIASQFIPGKNWYYLVALREKDYLANVYQLRNIAILVGLLALTVAFLICRAVAKKLTEPLKEIMIACEQASRGDLTVRVRADKMSSEFAVLGESFNIMLESLSGFLTQILEMFNQVHQFNKKITAVTKNQVETVEQTNVLARQAATSVDTITSEIDSSKTASEKMLLAAANGEGALEKIALVIDKNAQVIDEHVAAVQKLRNNITKIADFMQLIQQISSQTHLLSLNASIEAARAGEHGRGFAVVAQEVKKLADSSSQAASEVAQLLKDIYQQSSVVTSQMAISQSVAEQGILGIHQTKSSLQEISLAIQETNRYIDLITESVQNISSGSEQVAAMIQVLASEDSQEEDGIDSREVSAKEIASLANRLDEMTEDLKTRLTVFKFTSEQASGVR